METIQCFRNVSSVRTHFLLSSHHTEVEPGTAWGALLPDLCPGSEDGRAHADAVSHVFHSAGACLSRAESTSGQACCSDSNIVEITVAWSSRDFTSRAFTVSDPLALKPSASSFIVLKICSTVRESERGAVDIVTNRRRLRALRLLTPHAPHTIFHMYAATITIIAIPLYFLDRSRL